MAVILLLVTWIGWLPVLNYLDSEEGESVIGIAGCEECGAAVPGPADPLPG